MNKIGAIIGIFIVLIIIPTLILIILKVSGNLDIGWIYAFILLWFCIIMIIIDLLSLLIAFLIDSFFLILRKIIALFKKED